MTAIHTYTVHIASYGQRHTHTAHNTHTYPIHVPHNYAYEWVVSIVIGIAISTHTHSQPAAIGISLLLFVAVTFCIHRSNRQIHTKSKKPSRRRKKHWISDSEFSSSPAINSQNTHNFLINCLLDTDLLCKKIAVHTRNINKKKKRRE